MSIQTLAQWKAAQRVRVAYTKSTFQTTIASSSFSSFNISGNFATGVLDVGNTANGLVHTDATAGYPSLPKWSSSYKAYLDRVEVLASSGSLWTIYDRLFVCGAYAFNANTTLASQPSFSSRVPNTNYNECQLWCEQVTASTGVQTPTITYMDQDGNTGATTGAFGPNTAQQIVGQCWQMPLAAGDSGIQKVESVLGGTASAGTFNVMILRPLITFRVLNANMRQDIDAMLSSLVELPAGAALYLLKRPDTTNDGIPSFDIRLAVG